MQKQVGEEPLTEVHVAEAVEDEEVGVLLGESCVFSIVSVTDLATVGVAIVAPCHLVGDWKLVGVEKLE